MGWGRLWLNRLPYSGNGIASPLAASWGRRGGWRGWWWDTATIVMVLVMPAMMAWLVVIVVVRWVVVVRVPMASRVAVIT